MTNLAAKTPITVALNTLFVAPENAREHIDAADEAGLEDFASSLDPDSSGQLIAIFVRLPIGDEARGHYVLDGRRRLAAFKLLLEAGRIDVAHPVTAILCETEEEITAACVTVNDQREELLDHVAKLSCMSSRKVGGAYAGPPAALLQRAGAGRPGISTCTLFAAVFTGNPAAACTSVQSI